MCNQINLSFDQLTSLWWWPTWQCITVDYIFEIIWHLFVNPMGECKRNRDLFQYKDCFCRYGDSHYKEQTIIRLSDLYNGNPYTGKTASLHCGNLYSMGISIIKIRHLCLFMGKPMSPKTIFILTLMLRFRQWSFVSINATHKHHECII